MTGKAPAGLSFGGAFAVFGAATAAITVAVYVLIPPMVSAGIPQIAAHMIAVGAIFFLLLVGAFVGFRREGYEWSALRERMWLNTPSGGDLLWALGTLVVVSMLSGGVLFFMLWLSKTAGFHFDANPPALGYRKLADGETWILGVHAAFLFCGIGGEELMWRGYLLPRMQAGMGRLAWAGNGLLWTMLHVPYGLSMVNLLPILFILPWVVQRRQNAWIGIIVHGIVSASGFYLIVFRGQG